jgi:hypothetical protein
MPTFLPLNFNLLNAKAEDAPIITDNTATTVEITTVFLIQIKYGIVGSLNNFL